MAEDEKLRGIPGGKQDQADGDEEVIDVVLVPAPVWEATIALLDENVTGKAARQVTNALENAPRTKIPVSMLKPKKE